MPEYVYLRPSEIRFSQDSIANKFADGTNLGEVLEDLLVERCFVSDFPAITVVNKDNTWITFDNRRLYLFKMMEHIGKCDEIKAKVRPKLPPGRLTSKSQGDSIRVRGKVVTRTGVVVSTPHENKENAEQVTSTPGAKKKKRKPRKRKPRTNMAEHNVSNRAESAQPVMIEQETDTESSVESEDSSDHHVYKHSGCTASCTGDGYKAHTVTPSGIQSQGRGLTLHAAAQTRVESDELDDEVDHNAFTIRSEQFHVNSGSTPGQQRNVRKSHDYDYIGTPVVPGYERYLYYDDDDDDDGDDDDVDLRLGYGTNSYGGYTSHGLRTFDGYDGWNSSELRTLGGYRTSLGANRDTPTPAAYRHRYTHEMDSMGRSDLDDYRAGRLGSGSHHTRTSGLVPSRYDTDGRATATHLTSQYPKRPLADDRSLDFVRHRSIHHANAGCILEDEEVIQITGIRENVKDTTSKTNNKKSNNDSMCTIL